MSDTTISIQTLDTEYFNHHNTSDVSIDTPDKNISNLKFSMFNNNLSITWNDCSNQYWLNNVIVRGENYIPANEFQNTIIETTNIHNGYSIAPLMDDNINPNTLYCYRIFSKFSNSDEVYSGFKNVFFIYAYESNSTVIVGDTIVAAGMILLDATHEFVTDIQISAWNAKADQITTYTKDEVNSLISSSNTSLATESKSGLMDYIDKIKLDSLNNYVHPISHPANMITGLATIATSGNYNDLANKPIISGLPTLAKVATTGLYSDLTGLPSIPVLPTFAKVTTTGLYSDLTGLPTIPVLPTFAKVATTGVYSDLSGLPAPGVTLASLSSVAISGNYNDLTNKPSLATVATSGSYNDLTNKPTNPGGLATVASSGSYLDLINTPQYSSVAATGSYSDLVNRPIKGSNTFNGSAGVVITLVPVQLTTNYVVMVTPSGLDIANNPGANLGSIYVIKTKTNITVYNSGTARTTFDYIIIYS